MATANTPKRAATYAPGIGKGIKEILGQEVVVVKASISERNYGGEMSPIVIVTLENGNLYHAWSQSLCDKIAEIPDDAWPLAFKFVSVPTSKPGQSTITFE